MGDDKDKIPVLPISGVLVLLAVLGVTIYSQPFKAGRPVGPEFPEHYAKVSARLWQDPFEAVLNGAKARKLIFPPVFNILLSKECNSRHKTQVDRCPLSIDRKGKQGKWTVLGVMVPGAPYAEDAEMRMRYRYAVLSGLGRLGYVPVDPEHIEFIKVLGDGPTEEQYTLSNIMPVEQFKRTEPESGDRILVLWMNESLFANDPLKRISRLASYLSPLIKPPGKNFRIIGPSKSDTLHEMVKEAWCQPTGRNQMTGESDRHVVYSATATVDNRTLLIDAVCEKPEARSKCNEIQAMSEEDLKKEMDAIFNAKGYRFLRTIGSDKAVARGLIKELMLRNVNLRDDRTHVLLVAEWDTYYGRSFERYMRDVNVLYEALTGMDTSSAKPGDLAELAKVGRRIRRISYLRGIDGGLPEKKQESGTGDNSKNEKKGDPSKDAKSLERPEGRSQYDYLRRLSEEMVRLNNDLKRSGTGEIKAVGVMGTDFYDKYLVLQALRQKFSDAVYFTTDMDAGFLHSEHIEWTRNLVIASNFDLSLRKDGDVDIQGEIPPFRDNYQTSVFLAVLKSFTDEFCAEHPGDVFCGKARNRIADFNSQRTPTDVEKGKSRLKAGDPMIFEVGRNRAALLADPGDTIHPRMVQRFVPVRKVAIMFACAFALLILTSTSTNKWLIDATVRHRVAAWTGIVLAVLAMALISWGLVRVSGTETEEPFSILEGISVWPAEILRAIAIVLSWVFFLRAYVRRKGSTEKISRYLLVDPKSSNEMKTPRKNDGGLIWNIMDLGWGRREHKDLALRDLWCAYRDHDRGLYRFCRVALIAALYLVLCRMIVSFDPPVSPLRGEISLRIDSWVIALSVISFGILVSYVFDVTTCCRRFISVASEVFERRVVPDSQREMRDRTREALQMIRIVADRSAVIGTFIFYPFIVWLIIFFSRINYFDNWRTPVSLAVVLSLGALYAWASALLLRWEAEKARSRIIGSLEKLEASLELGCSYEGLITCAIEKIKAVRDGAFARLSQHPVLQVLLLPFGGIGGVLGIELLSKLNL